MASRPEAYLDPGNRHASLRIKASAWAGWSFSLYPAMRAETPAKAWAADASQRIFPPPMTAARMSAAVPTAGWNIPESLRRAAQSTLRTRFGHWGWNGKPAGGVISQGYHALEGSSKQAGDLLEQPSALPARSRWSRHPRRCRLQLEQSP